MKLRGPKPREFPRGYPHSPLTAGQILRQRRMDLGLTLEGLARRIGCCYMTISCWERGKAQPLARHWPRLEATLGPGLLPCRGDLPGRVRANRLRLGLRQEDLAARAGVHVRTVRNCETGAVWPSRDTLSRLSAALGFELEDLGEVPSSG